MVMAENQYTRVKYYFWPSSTSICNLRFPVKQEDVVSIFTWGSFPSVNSGQTINIHLTSLSRFVLKAIP